MTETIRLSDPSSCCAAPGGWHVQWNRALMISLNIARRLKQLSGCIVDHSRLIGGVSSDRRWCKGMKERLRQQNISAVLGRGISPEKPWIHVVWGTTRFRFLSLSARTFAVRSSEDHRLQRWLHLPPLAPLGLPRSGRPYHSLPLPLPSRRQPNRQLNRAVRPNQPLNFHRVKRLSRLKRSSGNLRRNQPPSTPLRYHLPYRMLGHHRPISSLEYLPRRKLRASRISTRARRIGRS